jgi:DNA modification methylase
MGENKIMKEKYQLFNGNNIDKLRELEDNSVDAVVTDPPYGLSFMGKKWDYDVPSVELWAECLRVLKPGGHLLAFAGTRTQHRMAVRIEDAGFEIRDMIAWVYGSGFPKSHDVSKAIDKAAGAEREVVGFNQNWRTSKSEIACPQQENQATITAPATPEAKQWEGWGTALKPSWESITVAQKSIQSSSEIEDLFASLLQQIKIQICQSPSLATTVEQILRSSPNGLNEGLSIAQWIAEKSINTQGDLFVLMATLQSCSTENTNWSIVSLWLNILEELYKAMSTCTIETKSSLIIDLKTLKLLEWESIFQSIIHAKDNLTNGLTANVWNAESLFSGLRLRLKIIHELSAQEAATSKEKHLNFAPNCSPIIMSRKPLTGTVAENVLRHGTGAINVDGGRVEFVSDADRKESTAKNQHADFGTAPITNNIVYGDYSMMKPKNYNPPGRWPANFIHDGSDEVADLLKDSARFFYCAKASKADREAGCEGLKAKHVGHYAQDEWSRQHMGNTPDAERKPVRNFHPTVKPTDLMRYLCKLITPPGGIVLDPFMGSGSTGCAALLDGFKFIGMELDDEYFKIAEARITHFNPSDFW